MKAMFSHRQTVTATTSVIAFVTDDNAKLQKENKSKLGFFVIFRPADNYMFNVNNRNTRTKCEICSTLTIKIKLGHISYLVLFLLLTLSR